MLTWEKSHEPARPGISDEADRSELLGRQRYDR